MNVPTQLRRSAAVKAAQAFCGLMACLIGLPVAVLAAEPASDTDAKVEALLRQMTLEEKVGQMCQYLGVERIRLDAKKAGSVIGEEDFTTITTTYPGLSIGDIEQMIREGKIGSILFALGPKEANRLQAIARQGRLKIPLIMAIDAIHGDGLVRGTTVYPTPLSLASAFDVELVEKIARQTALEVRANGSHWVLSPNVDVARDARWGRVGETFGEDPLLVGRMGAAMVRGYQGLCGPTSNSVLACIKHLVAGSAPVNGLNFAPMDVSEHTLRSIYLPPFVECVQSGAGSLMPAHHDLNSTPCHANRWIIEDLMRRENNFRGIAISDWMDIERLADLHFVAANQKEAVYQSVMAGVDMHMHGPGFATPLIELVNEGRVPQKRVDESVRRILRAKFELGLFDHWEIPLEDAAKITFCAEHQQTALEAARKSIVLLKNEGALLPLDPDRYKKILVAGPLADSPALMGDWVFPQPDENVTTVLEGVKMIAAKDCMVLLNDCGGTARTTSSEAIAAVAKQAREADLTILVVGENSFRAPPFNKDRTSGENIDRSDIELPGQQLDLVKAVVASGKPVVVVLINSRPIGSEWTAEHSSALVEAWEPGCKGGQAVAEVLFGKVNPSGRLPITVPRTAGHIQTIYNHKPSQYSHNYALGKTGPLFWFGHGLSYTTFTYSNLKIPAAVESGNPIRVKVDVTNSGTRAGDEVVLLYVRDLVSSVSTPVKELKAFNRVTIAPGETKSVELTVDYKQLALFDRELNLVVEPGEFEVFVGNLKERITARR